MKERESGAALVVVLMCAALMAPVVATPLLDATLAARAHGYEARRKASFALAEQALEQAEERALGAADAALRTTCEGSGCFSPACDAGRCFSGDYPAGAAPAECRRHVSGEEAWQNLENYSSLPWSPPQLTPLQRAEPAEASFVLEFLCFSGALGTASPPQRQPLFRVTVRLTGPVGEVWLQSLVSPLGRHGWRRLGE